MTVDRTRQHLVIFARRPALGVGKRRLARDVGDLEALRFARTSFARLTRTLGSDRRWTLWIATSPDRPTDWARPWPTIEQGPGDLGAKLSRVVRALPPGPVVILGSDLPDVRPADVASAFVALGSNQAVFGPAVDGGYWLVGFRRGPRLHLPFRNVRWSTEHTLADTLRGMGNQPVAMLDTREDVDDGPSLRRHLVSRRANSGR